MKRHPIIFSGAFASTIIAMIIMAPSAKAASILDLTRAGSGIAGENTLVDDNREYLIDRVNTGTQGQLDVGDSVRGMAVWSKLNGNPLGFGTVNNEITSVFQLMITEKIETGVGSGEYIFRFGPDPSFGEAVALGLGGKAMAIFYEDSTAGGATQFGALDYDDPTSPLPVLSIDDGTMSNPPSSADVSNNAAKVHEEAFVSTATDGDFFWALGYTGATVGGVATAADGEGWEVVSAGPDNVLSYFDVDSGTDLSSINFSLNRTLTAGLTGLGENLSIRNRESFIDPSFGVEFNGSATIEGVRNERTSFETSSQSTLTFAIIPVPAAAWLGLALMGGLGAVRSVRRRLSNAFV